MPRKKTTSERKRVPFGGHRTRLQTEQRKGYVRRWFNDTEDRIQRALDAGYTFVEDKNANVGEGDLHQGNTDLNGKVSKIVSKGGGNPIRAFLLEIPKAYYDEDQKSKEMRNRMVDDAIRSGTPGGSTVEKGYIPSTGIKHSHN